MIFKHKKKLQEQLQQSFGKIKDESFDFDLIGKYFKGKDNSKTFQVISDKTCNDLDFEELFMYLDRTTSKVGQQYLYQQLRVISEDFSSKDEELVRRFKENSRFRESVQEKLIALNNYEAYYATSLFQESQIEKPRWFFICKILSFISLSLVILIPFVEQVLLFLLFVFILNMGFHFLNKRNLYQYLVSIPQLLRLMNSAEELLKIDDLKILNPKVKEKIQSFSGIKIRLSFFKLTAKLDNDVAALADGLLELFKILFLLEPLLLFGTLKKLEAKKEAIESIYVYVGKIDFLISIASLREGLNEYCNPVLVMPDKKMYVSGVYHPLIPDCVKNNLELTEKSVLFTGSNMSGKTSFIRIIGINAITGLTLNTCFADKFHMQKMRVYSAIRINDDLLNDKSYYFEEVLTVKSMIDICDDDIPNLFLLDEIFKGTNTVERIAAGKAVLSSLNTNGNIVLVATHDIELTDLLKNEFDLYHFSESVRNKSVDFDYKLKEGRLQNRNAIRILEINDYPKRIIEEAINISRKLDKSNKGLVSSSDKLISV